MEEAGKRPREVLKYSFWDLHRIMWFNGDVAVEFGLKKGVWIWNFPRNLECMHFFNGEGDKKNMI
jgi:hypothetical protein